MTPCPTPPSTSPTELTSTTTKDSQTATQSTSSPSTTNRTNAAAAISHYQQKRDSILTNLNQSSFVNGSQYALLLVSPSGQVETYGSSLLEPNLRRWFGNNSKDGVAMGISQEAQNICSSNRLQPHLDQASPLLDSRFQNVHSSTSSSPNSPSHAQLANGMVRPATVAPVVVVSRGDGDENRDVNGERNERVALAQQEGTIKVPRGKKRARDRPVVAPIDINAVNQRNQLEYQRDGLLSAGGLNPPHSSQHQSQQDYPQPPHSAPLPIHDDRSGMVQMGMVNENPDTPTVGTMPLHHPYEPMQEIFLATHQDRTSFFELRLQQMQSVVCKTIAKAWIKVIEPKKQSYHPYKLGEAAKPAWWPAGSRHREPDHLFLPERKNLIIGLLRSPHTNISALQTATAEIPSRIIRPDKAALLMDVYAVAREEENMRYAGADLNTPMRIRVSTLAGWKPEGNDNLPVASAMEKSKSMGPTADSSSASNNSRKRPSPPAMSRTASEGRKRQALDPSASLGDQDVASQAQAAAGLVIDANSSWRWQQQAGPSMQSQPQSTPVRQTAHLTHGSEPRSQTGYYHGGSSVAPMSAQIPYANLYPLGSPFGPQAQAQAQAQTSQHHLQRGMHPQSSSLLSQHRGSLSTPFSFAPLPSHGDDLHHQHMMLHQSPEESQGASSGALGLHGIDNGPQETFGSQAMAQQQSHHNEHMLRRDISNISADTSGELSFDSSGYADSYLSSNGPRTPTSGRTPSPGPVRPFDHLGLEEVDGSSSQQDDGMRAFSLQGARRRGISNGSTGFNTTSSQQSAGQGGKEELDRIQQQLDSFEWNQHGLMQHHGTLA